MGTFDIQVGFGPRVPLGFTLTARLHPDAKILHAIIGFRFSVFGAPAIVDVSATHDLRRLLIHDLTLVREVHVRLGLVFHVVPAQDGVVHGSFDVFLRPPRPILFSLDLRPLPADVRVAHVEHRLIHDGGAEHELVLVCSFLILPELPVILFCEKIGLFDLEFFPMARRNLMERLRGVILAAVRPDRAFV